MLYPKRLEVGDTIGVIAPASSAKTEKLLFAKSFFEGLGLQVTFSKNIEAIHGYLAGTDEERLQDLHDMFVDPKIKGIFCARGGYGTPRLVDKIDFNIIQRNPKIFWGYSDITYLHTAIYQKTGLVTFHGPMLASDITDFSFDKLSAAMFRQLFEPTELLYTEQISPLNVVNPGIATGRLVGGNLSLIVSTLGTPYEMNTKDALLLIEDIDEAPYKVDSMLNQLKLAGKLEEAAGIVIGDFANSLPKSEPSLRLEEVFAHYFSSFGGPVMSGFKIGHCSPHFAVPLGVEAVLDTRRKCLSVAKGVC